MSAAESQWDDETLVAFLDGELSAEQSARLRSAMSADANLQRRVGELRVAWQLLDELPPAQPNPQLAQSTIELITQDLAAVTRRRPSWYKRYAWWSIVPLTFLAGSMGWQVSKAQSQRQFQASIDDIQVLVHLRDLDNIDSAAWLDRLASIPDLERAGLPLHVENNIPEPPLGRSQFKNWVAQLDNNQKLSLQAAFRSFEATDQDRRKSLRELANHFSGESSSQNTANLIRAYSGLMNRLGSTEAVQIKSQENLDLRAQEIEQVIHRELAIAYANQLSQEERNRISNWCDEIKESSFYFLNSEDPDAEIIRLLDVESPDANILPADIERLIMCVDSEGRSLLNKLDNSMQTKVLKLWLTNSLPGTRSRPQFSSAEMLERFHKLPVQRQNELIYLPANEVAKILSQDSDGAAEK